MEVLDIYEHASEDLVSLALRKDKGQDVDLLSFEFKPITNIGENYASFITTVLVKYLKGRYEGEESYFVKFNRKRPVNTYTEIFQEIFGREIDVLTIIEGMNAHLEKLKLPPIRAPKLYAKSLEKGKEVLIAENLALQGFKVFDIRKGLDVNHAQLVLKELGRFHASSLLYEEGFFPKTIPDLFQHFKESRYDCRNEPYKIYDALISSHTETIYNILKKSNPKYEKAVKWLGKYRDRMINYFIDGCLKSKTFNILAHGDCHSNNMLFKYDDNNIPVDVRLVDFQCSRKASPASDLNFFFYTSLNGDLRINEMDRMLITYYDSFVEVLNKAGKESPISYEELVCEVKNRRMYGLSTTLYYLPIIMRSNPLILSVSDSEKDKEDQLNEKESENLEAMMETEGPLKDRILGAFEEMIDEQLFD